MQALASAAGSASSSASISAVDSRRPGARARRAARLSRTLSSGKTCRPSGTSASPRARDPVGLELARCARRRGTIAPPTGRSRPRQRAHGGRFAGAVGAEQRDQLARPHLEGDVVEHGRGAIAGGELSGGEHASAVRPASGAARGRAPHLAAAEIGLEHLRIAGARLRACRRRCGRPASSTTTWSEMPITSAMSCSTRMTAMPGVGELAQERRRARPCRRASGRRPARRAAARCGRVGERAGDLDQAPVDMRQIAGRAVRARRGSRRKPAGLGSARGRRRSRPRRSGLPSRPRRSADQDVVEHAHASRTAASSDRCARCRRARRARRGAPASSRSPSRMLPASGR